MNFPVDDLALGGKLQLFAIDKSLILGINFIFQFTKILS